MFWSSVSATSVTTVSGKPKTKASLPLYPSFLASCLCKTFGALTQGKAKQPPSSLTLSGLNHGAGDPFKCSGGKPPTNMVFLYVQTKIQKLDLVMDGHLMLERQPLPMLLKIIERNDRLFLFIRSSPCSAPSHNSWASYIAPCTAASAVKEPTHFTSCKPFSSTP